MISPAGRALLLKEVRELFLGRAFWVQLGLLSLLVGTSFEQALRLYSEASRAALTAPELGRGLSPFDGVLVPTFGALYLATTLLWPFVAIRQLGGDLRSGAFKLLVQTPFGLASLIGTKLVALALGFALAVGVPLSAVVFWWSGGGHVFTPELLGLVCGHALYALVVAALSFAVAAWADSTPTASLVVLGATLGSWALDFAAAGEDGALARLAGLSLTQVLRPWERGLLVSANFTSWFLASLLLLYAARLGLRRAVRPRTQLLRVAAVAAACTLFVPAAGLHASRDLTEDRRNSFAPEEEAALARIDSELRVEVFLVATDPRRQELERAVLSKLRRCVRRLSVEARAEAGSRFGAGEDAGYGQVVYSYKGRSDTSRSTSPREVLPLLFELAEQAPVHASPNQYPGYPLVAGQLWNAVWFFVLLPALIVAGTSWRSWSPVLSGGEARDDDAAGRYRPSLARSGDERGGASGG